jgi:hemoglobin/transferrin/lactoferrin receptor protein
VFINFNGWKRIEDYFPNGEDNEIYATAKGMPSWYTINLRAGYEFNKYLALQVGVDNLLDLQYRTFASGINAPGRNLFGTVRVSF